MFQEAMTMVVVEELVYWRMTPVAAGAISLQHRSMRRMLAFSTNKKNKSWSKK